MHGGQKAGRGPRASLMNIRRQNPSKSSTFTVLLQFCVGARFAFAVAAATAFSIALPVFVNFTLMRVVARVREFVNKSALTQRSWVE